MKCPYIHKEVTTWKLRKLDSENFVQNMRSINSLEISHTKSDKVRNENMHKLSST